jgi:hypothetical protein
MNVLKFSNVAVKLAAMKNFVTEKSLRGRLFGGLAVKASPDLSNTVSRLVSTVGRKVYGLTANGELINLVWNQEAGISVPKWA